MNKTFSIVLFCFLLFIVSCDSCKQKDKAIVPPPQTPVVKKAVPQFNADSAYAFVKNQVDFGPRVPGSEAHAKCAEYFKRKLNSYQWEVMEQNAVITTYDNKKYTLKNIIASSDPSKKNRVLLCAHWDTRPIADRDVKEKDKAIDGANDGASGAGVLLEIARQLQKSKPNIGVDLILFDLEDYGQPDNSGFPKQENTWCLGSQYWAKNPHKPGYYASYGILLDMVGASDATFGRELTSEYYASAVVRKVWQTASRLGYSDYFLQSSTGPITDDHYYINTLAAIPTIDIVHIDPKTNDFGHFHHTHADNIKIIDKNTLWVVGQTLLHVLYSE